MRFALILLVILIALSIVDCHKKKRRHNRRGQDHKHHHRRGHQKRGHGHHGHHGFEKSLLFNPVAQLSGRSGTPVQSRMEKIPSGNENLDGFPECYLLDSISEKCGDHSLNTILTKMKPCSDQKLLKKISGHAVRACRRNGNQWLNAAKALVASNGNRYYLDFAEFQTSSFKIRGDQLKESLANHLFKNQRSAIIEPEKKIKSRDNNLTNAEVVNDPDLSGVDKLKELLSRGLEVASDAPEAKIVQVSLNEGLEPNITQGEPNESEDQEKEKDFDALKYVEDTMESAKLKFWKFVEFFKQDEGNGTFKNTGDESIPLVSKLTDLLTLLGVVRQEPEPAVGDDVTILEPVDEEQESPVDVKIVATTEDLKTEENDSETNSAERNEKSSNPQSAEILNEKQDSANDEGTENKSDSVEMESTTLESGSVERDDEVNVERIESSERENSVEQGSEINEEDEPKDLEMDDEGNSSNREIMDDEDLTTKQEDPVIVVEPNPKPVSIAGDQTVHDEGEIFSILVKDESASEEGQSNSKDEHRDVVLLESEKENPTEPPLVLFNDEKNDEEAKDEVERILNQLASEFGNNEDNLSKPVIIDMEDLKAEMEGGKDEGNLIPEDSIKSSD